MPLLRVPYEGKYSVALHAIDTDDGKLTYTGQLHTEAESRSQDLPIVEFRWPNGKPYIATGTTTYEIPGHYGGPSGEEHPAATLTFIPWKGVIQTGRYRLLPTEAEGQTCCVTHSRWLLPAQNGICGMEAIDHHACRYATLVLL